ncbi:MAG TPA: hypothetical protein VFJ82_01380 [Longimicrobium sp.]|nr:hypothetical protein [Longimicrobium sp.]
MIDSLRGAASKSRFILREEGAAVYLSRATRALVSRVRRVLRDQRENRERWRALRGRYAGQRAFLIGNGPSLNRTPLHLLAGERTMCFNRFNLMFERLAWRPTMYCNIDDRVLLDMVDEVNEVVPQVELAFFPDLHPYNIDFTRHIRPAANVYWLHLDRLTFTTDLPFCGINKTVANVGLQVLAYLGFAEIYLVGVDMDYQTPADIVEENRRDWTATADSDPNHFDPRYFGAGRSYHRPRMDETLLKFQEAKAFLDGLGIRAYNAGVGGKLEVFPRVDFRSLFAVSYEDELRALLPGVAPVPGARDLATNFPGAVRVRTPGDWNDAAELLIAGEALGPGLISRTIFTHVPYGPIGGEYLFRRRHAANGAAAPAGHQPSRER